MHSGFGNNALRHHQEGLGVFALYTWVTQTPRSSSLTQHMFVASVPMGPESGSGLACSSGSRPLCPGDSQWSPQAQQGEGLAPSSLSWLLQDSRLGWLLAGALDASPRGPLCTGQLPTQRPASLRVRQKRTATVAV